MSSSAAGVSSAKALNALQALAHTRFQSQLLKHQAQSFLHAVQQGKTVEEAISYSDSLVDHAKQIRELSLQQKSLIVKDGQIVNATTKLAPFTLLQSKVSKQKAKANLQNFHNTQDIFSLPEHIRNALLALEEGSICSHSRCHCAHNNEEASSEPCPTC